MRTRAFKVGIPTAKDLIQRADVARQTIFDVLNVKDEMELVGKHAGTLETVAAVLEFTDWRALLDAWRADDVMRGLSSATSRPDSSNLQPFNLTFTVGPGGSPVTLHGSREDVERFLAAFKGSVFRYDDDTAPAPPAPADTAGKIEPEAPKRQAAMRPVGKKPDKQREGKK